MAKKKPASFAIRPPLIWGIILNFRGSLLAIIGLLRLLLSIIAGEKPVLMTHGLTPPEIPDPPDNISIDV